MMRIGTVAAAVLLMLAGCADESTPVQEATHTDFELKAGDTTGVIRGVVVDSQIVPIDGAEIRLGNEGPTQVSNANGEFAFSEVPAGIQNLYVDAEGFVATTVQTNVEAGVVKPPVVTVQLPSDPSELPVVVPLTFTGYIGCSISSPAYRVAVCSLADPTGDVFKDNFMVTHEGLARNASYIQAEMIWRSTQQMGTAMMFTMEHSVSDGGEIAPQAQGESPLVIRADSETVANSPYETHIIHRVFNFEHPATTPPVPVCGIPNPVHGGDMCAKGVGATLQQEFEIFTHVFYRYSPSETWQFSIDGPPVMPS